MFKEDPGDVPRRLGHYNAMRMGGMMVGALLAGAGYYWLDFPATLKLFSVGTAAPDRAHGQTAADPGGAHHPL